MNYASAMQKKRNEYTRKKKQTNYGYGIKTKANITLRNEMR